MKGSANLSLAMACAVAPLIVGCNGSSPGAPPAITPTQCTASSCPSGTPVIVPTATQLCPANADIVKSTYLGGTGAGEIASINIDAVNSKYTLRWYDSPVPTSAGQVTNTRAGLTVTGAVTHPPTGALPTAEQLRCAFVLLPASTADGSYTTPFNQANPPMVFVGMGVAGGGVPGATLQFNGVLGVGAVPKRTFDFYPFLAFASTTTDLSKLRGTDNGLMYHLVPSSNYATAGAQTTETFDASGNCTSTQTGGCKTTGGAWTLNGTSGNYFNSASAPQILPQTLPLGKTASAHMVLGQLNGLTIPVVVRTGDVNLSAGHVDDESGLAMMLPATSIASGAVDGGYVGADSNFKYTAALLQGAGGAFVNPSTSTAQSSFGISYAQSASPGLLDVTDSKTGATGWMIAGGGMFGVLINGVENGGVTASSANSDSAQQPYFGAGARVGK
jgi:Protein of unknown function (DUF2957)